MHKFIWDGTELTDYIQEGYEALTLATGCLWETATLPDYVAAFNYTASWEFDFFIAGNRISGLAQFTAEFERDFLNNARGPANLNFHWEYNQGYAPGDVFTEGVVTLPDDLYEIERATWDTQRIEALRSRFLENDDSRYELNKGNVEAYTQDKDGLRRLRKWRVPSTPYVPYEVEGDLFGVLVRIDDVTTDPILPGDRFGDFVQIPGEHMMVGSGSDRG